MLSFRCLHGKHHDCTGALWFGRITDPQSTWQDTLCHCACHVYKADPQLELPL